MDFTSLIAPAIGSTVIGGLLGSSSNKQAKKQAENYRRAMEYLMQQQNLPLNGFYASARQNGISTGTGYDDVIRAMNSAQIGKQLDAARLNLARKNLTDADARARVFSQQVAQNKALNDGAINNAARVAIRRPTYSSNMKSVYNAGKRDAVKGNNLAYANAMNAMANNDANYYNNPALTEAMNLGNAYNNRRQQYNNTIAGLMSGTPAQGMSTGNWALLSGLGGLMNSYNQYQTYGGNK